MNNLEKENKILREILIGKCFYAAPRDFSRSGYSLEVEPETAYRDIELRDAVLFKTPEEALDFYMEKHYGLT